MKMVTEQAKVASGREKQRDEGRKNGREGTRSGGRAMKNELL